MKVCFSNSTLLILHLASYILHLASRLSHPSPSRNIPLEQNHTTKQNGTKTTRIKQKQNLALIPVRPVQPNTAPGSRARPDVWSHARISMRPDLIVTSRLPPSARTSYWWNPTSTLTSRPGPCLSPRRRLVQFQERGGSKVANK